MNYDKTDNIIKWFLIIFCSILIPIYIYHYGIINFLWFSDIGLLLTLISLVRKNPIYISVASLGFLLFELTWAASFFLELFLDISFFHLTSYMFDVNYPLYLRLLSLFHLFMPVIWFYYLNKWGYKLKSIIGFLFFYWVIVTLSYLLSSKQENINWVFSFYPYLISAMYLIIPIIIFVPMHKILKKLYEN